MAATGCASSSCDARNTTLVIENIKRSASLDTPGCLFYSRSGGVPHLTSDNLHKVHSAPILATPMSSLIEQPSAEVMRAFGMGYHAFAGIDEFVIVALVHDTFSGKPMLYKHNEEKAVSVWAPSGRQRVNPVSFLEHLDVYDLDAAVILSDQVQSPTETAKRCRKSNERTVRFTTQVLALEAANEDSFEERPLFVAVEGGADTFQREKCMENLLKLNQERVGGYVLSGIDYLKDNWLEIVQLCCRTLPRDMPRYLPGIFTPSEVVRAVRAGVDIFDTTSAHFAADRGCALNFPFRRCKRAKLDGSISADGAEQQADGAKDATPQQTDIGSNASKIQEAADSTQRADSTSSTDPPTLTTIPDDERPPDGDDKHPAELPSAELPATELPPAEITDPADPTPAEPAMGNAKDFRMYEMDLLDSRYFADMRPLVEGCACYMCQHHHRAYLNHLLVTKEMLAQVLLTMHNLHHWLEFFSEVRSSIRTGTFDQLHHGWMVWCAEQVS